MHNIDMFQIPWNNHTFVPKHAIVASVPVPSQPRAMAEAKVAQRTDQAVLKQGLDQTEDKGAYVQDLALALQELANVCGFYKLPGFKHLHGNLDRRLDQKILAHGMFTFENLLITKGHRLTRTDNAVSMSTTYMRNRFKRYIPLSYFETIETQDKMKDKIMVLRAASAFIRDMKAEAKDQNRRMLHEVGRHDQSLDSLVPVKSETVNEHASASTFGINGKSDLFWDNFEIAATPMVDSRTTSPEATKRRQEQCIERLEREYRIDQALLKIDKWATAWLDGELADHTAGSMGTSLHQHAQHSCPEKKELHDIHMTSDFSTTSYTTPRIRKEEGRLYNDDWYTLESCLALPDIIKTEDIEDGEILEHVANDEDSKRGDDDFVQVKIEPKYDLAWRAHPPRGYSAITTRTTKERCKTKWYQSRLSTMHQPRRSNRLAMKRESQQQRL